MFEIAGLIVSLGVGLSLWRTILFLYSLYEEHVPDTVQERIYKTSKDLPKILWAWCVGLVFWTSAGAVLVRLMFSLFGFEGSLRSAAWAPGIFFPLLMSILFQFWETPPRTKDSFKARGRKMQPSVDSVNKKNTPPTSSEKRGRTIRSYHDIS